MPGYTWLAAMAVCICAGVAFSVGHSANVDWLREPKGMGYYLAGLAFVGGLAFGWRATALPFAGLGAYGLAGLVGEGISPTSGPGSGDVTGTWVLFLTYFPPCLQSRR